jgi:hypothetical protein
LLWGFVAQWWGLVPTFVAAAAVMALGTATVVVWPLRDVTGLSRDLAVFMPEPELTAELRPGEGPVLVTLTYTIEDDRVPEFLDVMAELRRSRLRTGATRSELFRDGANPTRFVQVSAYPTWEEHLRQHTGRLTGADQALYQAAKALADGAPEARHMFTLPGSGRDRAARLDNAEECSWRPHVSDSSASGSWAAPWRRTW